MERPNNIQMALTWEEIRMYKAEASRLERERCLKAVDEEPEDVNTLSPYMFEVVENMTEADVFCELVHRIKANIRKRIEEGV